MAATVLFALLGSLVFALMLMPVLSTFFLSKQQHKEQTLLMRHLDRLYRPLLQKVILHPRITFGIAAGVFAVSLAAIPFLGAELISSLDEGSLLVQMYRVPGISISESLHGNEITEKVLREFPEVSQLLPLAHR